MTSFLFQEFLTKVLGVASRDAFISSLTNSKNDGIRRIEAIAVDVASLRLIPWLGMEVAFAMEREKLKVNCVEGASF